MKKKRILIDPGHYGKCNQYTILLPTKYSEAEMNWKLSNYQKSELEALGFEVDLTRSDPNKDVDVVTRGKMAKGYDLLLSNHSNACNTESVNRAVMCCYQDLKNSDIDDVSVDVGHILGQTIKKVMGLTGYQIYRRKASSDRDRDGILNDEYYGILYGARLVGTPAVIVEHSFHTNKKAAKWLYSTSNLKKLAKAEAKALAEYYNMIEIGDVNGDGTVDSLDAVEILKYDAGIKDLTPEQKSVADYNKDGSIDSLDAVKILKHDAGLE